MFERFVCALLTLGLLRGLTTDETGSPAGVPLVQVEAKRIHAVEMHNDPYNGQDLMQSEELIHARSRCQHCHHTMRHSHHLPSTHAREPPSRFPGSHRSRHTVRERGKLHRTRTPRLHIYSVVKKVPTHHSLRRQHHRLRPIRHEHRRHEEVKQKSLEKGHRHREHLEVKEFKPQRLEKQKVNQLEQKVKQKADLLKLEQNKVELEKLKQQKAEQQKVEQQQKCGLKRRCSRKRHQQELLVKHRLKLQSHLQQQHQQELKENQRYQQQHCAKIQQKLQKVQHLENKLENLQKKLRKKQKSYENSKKTSANIIIKEKERPACSKKEEPVIYPLEERMIPCQKQQQTSGETNCCCPQTTPSQTVSPQTTSQIIAPLHTTPQMTTTSQTMNETAEEHQSSQQEGVGQHVHLFLAMVHPAEEHLEQQHYLNQSQLVKHSMNLPSLLNSLVQFHNTSGEKTCDPPCSTLTKDTQCCCRQDSQDEDKSSTCSEP